MIRGKRILITGGNGFIGAALATRLSPHNDVTLLDLSFSGDNDLSQARRVVADITDENALIGIARGNQIIIHTAAKIGVKEVIGDALATLHTNYTGTANLLRASLLNPYCERVISFSTSEVFGANSSNVAENSTSIFPSIQDARWCYGAGKLAAEHLAFGYYRQHGLPIVIVRPFNVFGEGRVGDYAMLNLILRALHGDDLAIYGNGTQIRAWCHIDDFCFAIIRCMESEKAIGQAFNIGNPHNTVTVYDLAQRVIRACGSMSRITFVPLNFTDIELRIPDISKAKSILGFNPGVGLDEGLERTVNWARKNIAVFDYAKES